MPFRSTSRIALLSLFSLGTACSGTPQTTEPGPRGSACTRSDECLAGLVCRSEICEQLCATNGDCPAGEICSAVQICDLPANGVFPEITDVVGNDNGDATRILDGMFVRGNNLGDATLALTDGVLTPILTVVSQSTTEIEVRFPADVRIGAYTLTATNNAGTAQATITLTLPDLTGEQLIARINTTPLPAAPISASYLPVGTTATDVAAGDDSRFHAPYTDAQAITAMGALDAANPLHHDRFTIAETQAIIDTPRVSFSLTGNLVPDPMLADATAWSDPPDNANLPLPGYPTLLSPAYAGVSGYLGAVHVSTEAGTGCYQWAVSSPFPVDVNRAYEFSIWIRSEDTTLDNYFGFFAYDGSGAKILAPWDNPYFKGNEGDPGVWTRFSGYILPSNAPDLNNDGRVDTQVSLSNGADWRWPAAATTAVVRFGACYGDGAGAHRSYFALPSVREVVF